MGLGDIDQIRLQDWDLVPSNTNLVEGREEGNLSGLMRFGGGRGATRDEQLPPQPFPKGRRQPKPESFQSGGCTPGSVIGAMTAL